MLRLVSALGVLAIVGVAFACSRNRKAVSWRLVGTGIAIQAVLGGIFLGWDRGKDWLYARGEDVKAFLDLSSEGTEFVFGALGKGGGSLGFIFATQVLPTLIFFSAFMAVLYHLGVMQLIVRGMAWVMARLLRTSGSESLSACGNVFVGQTEAPLLVKPFLPGMTKSEIFTVMTGGFATIAGGVFALYVGFGIEAGHLMVASVMAVPAGLVCAKLLFPEAEQSATMGSVKLPEDTKTAGNVVEAAANGAIDGLQLALNVGAMLIAFLGLMAVLDALLGVVGEQIGASGWLVGEKEELATKHVLGWLFYPLAAVMGVPGPEVEALSQLIGTKIVATELVAYQELAKQTELSPRTVMIASFALCGFANVGSVAIQIGGLGAMAPGRKQEIASLAFRAMFAGALATCMTACMAGVMSS